LPWHAGDPIVFVTSGPGDSAFGYLGQLAGSPMRDLRQIIVVEQRGNGYAKPSLVCPEAASGADLDGIQKCRRRIDEAGIDVEAFNSDAVATDLHNLRLALGYPKWDVYGVSYGTFVSLRYAKAYPNDVRSLILDGVLPPEASLPDQPTAGLNAVSKLIDYCNADRRCKAAYPDLQKRLIALFARLSAQPLTIGASRIDAFALTRLTLGGINSRADLVPALWAALEARNTQRAGQLIAALAADRSEPVKGLSASKVFSLGYALSVLCREEAPFGGSSKAKVNLTVQWPTEIIAAVNASFDTFNACPEAWPITTGPADLAKRVVTSVPTLILSGDLDPNTPPAFSASAKIGLPRGTVVSIPRTGHVALDDDNGCVDRIVRAFLLLPGSRPPTDCLRGGSFRFALPGEAIR
jgi:pimeloyl-ACP methyl ester carboxylesterase